ncbi:MAG TPA: DUF4365 domain-containing protein [Puia sp.]|jgi:hypothetical protein
MDFEPEEIAYEGYGAPYPKSSESEEDASKQLQYRLNSKYIRANIRTMDKIPNFDGTLDVLDEQGRLVGQLQIQLKTLPKNRSTNPGYSCDEHFISACSGNLLPCLLVVVDTEGKKSYWRHINEQTISEFHSERSGQTYTIKCPIDQCIDGTDESYIQSWKKILHERRSRILNYGHLSQKLLQAEERLSRRLNDLHPADDLDEQTIFELQLFLDEYNGVLEKDFKGVREAEFLEYWKIGIVIVQITPMHLSYSLLPIPRGKDLPLIQRAGPERALQLLSPQSELLALFYAMDANRSEMRNNPKLYSYTLLRDTVEKCVENKHLVVEDLILAREYIVAFIDNYSNYLGFDPGQDKYSLARIKLLLEKIMPVVESESHHWHIDPATTSMNNNSRMTFSNKEPIKQAERFIAEGKQPKVKVSLWSDDFNIDVLYHYIDLLESSGETAAFRVFERNFKPRGIGKQDWQEWDRSVIVPNLTIFMNNVSRLYQGLLQRNFPGIMEQLKQRAPEIQIFVVKDVKDLSRHPRLEIFYLTSNDQLSSNRYLYDGDDPTCPVNAKRVFLENDPDCIIEDKHCKVYSVRYLTLDFLFTSTPFYSFMRTELTAVLRVFFNDLINHADGKMD